MPTKPISPGQDLADALAELAAAPQIVLVLVDERNRVLDIRRTTPAFLAAQLVHFHADSKGDASCGADAGSFPSSSA